MFGPHSSGVTQGCDWELSHRCPSSLAKSLGQTLGRTCLVEQPAIPPLDCIGSLRTRGSAENKTGDLPHAMALRPCAAEKLCDAHDALVVQQGTISIRDLYYLRLATALAALPALARRGRLDRVNMLDETVVDEEAVVGNRAVARGLIGQALEGGASGSSGRG